MPLSLMKDAGNCREKPTPKLTPDYNDWSPKRFRFERATTRARGSSSRTPFAPLPTHAGTDDYSVVRTEKNGLQ